MFLCRIYFSTKVAVLTILLVNWYLPGVYCAPSHPSECNRLDTLQGKCGNSTSNAEMWNSWRSNNISQSEIMEMNFTDLMGALGLTRSDALHLRTCVLSLMSTFRTSPSLGIEEARDRIDPPTFPSEDQIRSDDCFQDSDVVVWAVFTHSTSADIWPVLLGQLQKHLIFNNTPVLWIVDDTPDPEIEEYVAGLPSQLGCVKVMRYNDRLSLRERYKWILSSIASPYLVHLQEDWIPTDPIDHRKVLRLVDLMEEHSLSTVRAYDLQQRAAQLPDPEGLFIQPHALWLLSASLNIAVSFQPAVWRRDHLLRVFTEFDGSELCEFERPHIQAWARADMRVGCVGPKEPDARTAMVGSFLYPHIHAVARGKWALYDGLETALMNILKNYGVDPDLRGVTR